MPHEEEKSAYDLGWNYRLKLTPEIPDFGMVEMEEFLRGYKDCNIACYEEITSALREFRSPKYPKPR